MTDMALDPNFNLLRIRNRKMVAEDICLFELEHPERKPLPPFQPGDHVVVVTPSGLRRSYSLSNHPAETERYLLGIKIEKNGRGGSRSMLESALPGEMLAVSTPERGFPLVDAAEYLFIAGGIGITPIISMVRWVASRNHSRFRLVYCTRSPSHTAFLDDLTAEPLRPFVTIHHDEGNPEHAYDLWPLLEKPDGSQIYCCGPTPLMEDVRGMTGHWPPSAIHFEDFGSDVQAHRGEDTAFTVRNVKSGEVVTIPAEATILETLRRQGIDRPSSCESGTCGSCRTRLVEGEADHRDLVLTEEERASHIMICVSRARSGELVLEW